MTSRGPFQPKTFYDSMILKGADLKINACISTAMNCWERNLVSLFSARTERVVQNFAKQHRRLIPLTSVWLILFKTLLFA